ncbi:MAG: SDR family oxidoreductase [Actinomycetia bacterium]|nr:SDR family oxidoreductase [Actinomycetes bacterium]
MNSKQLLNKVSIITGAGSGIGKAIAKIFAAEGAYVIINDIDLNKVLEIANEINSSSNKNSVNKAFAIKADVTNSKEVDSMIKIVEEKFGTIDILVNSAGILFTTRFEDITEEEWDKVINVNLKGTFICCKAVVPFMKKNKWGRIINISSLAGKTVSTSGGAHYTASKAGVLGLTRAIAKELVPFNINVNAVCPGSSNTEMTRKCVSKEKITEYEKINPLGRLCEPDEVANLVLFLASEKSSYIVGASIDINGDALII